MKIAVVSLNQIWLDKQANFDRCVELIDNAVIQGCELFIFPEMTLTGYSLETDKIAEQLDNSKSIEMFKDLSRSTGIHIVFGLCLISDESSLPENVLCHSNPNGNAKPVYSKIHPFSYSGEDKVIGAGNKLGYLELPNMKFGGSICYDLRFPELYTAMAEHCVGAICIANWPTKRIEHWRSLMIARAIESQMFMIGVNRIGVDGNGLEDEKSSMVVGPDGIQLEPLFESSELDAYDIDLMHTKKYRDEFPTLRDRRDRIYANLREAYEG